MSMTKRLWSVNALATEFSLDRRTVARRIADVPYAAKDRGSPRWHIEDVVWCLAPDPQPGRSATDKFDPIADAIADRLTHWRTIFTPAAVEAGRVNLDDFAELAGLDRAAALNCLRAGMPYRTVGDFETGDGFEFQVHHAAEWIGFAKCWLARAGRKDLMSRLGL